MGGREDGWDGFAVQRHRSILGKENCIIEAHGRTEKSFYTGCWRNRVRL